MADQSVPRPPDDSEMKTIIDKLANFVARNGPEFEKMTMSKKNDDPKFSFLFGGEFNPYYRWKVEMERVQTGVISANPSLSHHHMHPSSTAGPTPQDTTESVSANDSGFIESLHTVKTKEQMDVSTNGTQDPLEVEFNNVVKPVMDTCSKEAIASGKGWIFSRSRTPEECGRMAHYIMRRSLDFPGVGFNNKLHLVYLINDLLHHCIRKGADDLQQAMETVIVQIFYNIFSSNSQNVDELKKILDIWEPQEYLSKIRLEQIRRVLDYPASELPPIYQPTVIPPPSAEGSTTINMATPSAPPPWQQSFPQQQPQHPAGPVQWQHQPYPSWEHAPPPPMPSGPSGPQLPWSHQTAPPPWVQQQQPPPPPPPPSLPQQQPTAPPPPSIPHSSTAEPTPLFSPSEPLVAPTNNEPSVVEKPPASELPPPEDIGKEESLLSNKETIDYNHQPPPSTGSGMTSSDFQQSIQVFDYQHRPANWDMGCGPPPPIPPPHMGGAPPFPFPHHQNPPPFFSHPPFPPHDMPPIHPPPHPPPSIPYFDLPAGLMVPLVPLHEHNYTPLKPHLVCLPPPQPPSERLIEAVEEFYYPPSEEKSRNEEGWEGKALLDFYDAKMKAKEAMRNRSRGIRKGPTHRRRSHSRSRSPKRRRRRSSSSRSQSRSYSPRRRRRSSRSPSSSSRSRSSSSSSRSYSPRRRRSRSSYSRSRSLSPSTPTIEEELAKRRSRLSTKSVSQAESIAEENVGHQLLKRMGWEGAGLGARGQGIQEPVKGGEARDKLNQFAGVGINMNDPFEQFRRNKSYTFNRRAPPPPGPGGGGSSEAPHLD